MERTQLDPASAATRPPDGTPRSDTSPVPGSPAPGTPPDLRALGDFRILRRLGEGGMGAVYHGYDGKSGRHVALKVLNDGLASNQGYLDRFRREARAGAALNHPNVVRTYDAGQDKATGKYYLVLEYVDGPSAEALLQSRGKLQVGDAVHVALDVARALEHAHSKGIIHRDVKPDNILLTRSGVAKLGDLGLARRADEPSHLTQNRQGFGTTAYMPYEQAISAKRADCRSDLYALGATLYHLLTGVVPFPGENHLEVVEKKNLGHYRPAGSINAWVPPALDHILAKMLARQPADRYQTASELIIDLERTRLAGSVPSFADPELARNDPWIQACHTTGEPTRLDPESSGVQAGAAAKEEWIVRYRNRAGRAFTSRLSADDVRERLEEGTLPADAEARREGDEGFRPLSEIDEFSECLPDEPEEAESDEEESDESAPQERRSYTAFYGLLAALVAAALVGLGRLLLSR
jgi:serine/threonine-protein kinase